MKFKVDENLPVEITEMLRQAGYNAESVFDEKLEGESDRTIAAICRIERRAIVTLDMDFADIRMYPPQNYSGIIVLRIARQDKFTVLSLFNRILPKIGIETLDGMLWVVDQQRIRIRG